MMSPTVTAEGAVGWHLNSSGQSCGASVSERPRGLKPAALCCCMIAYGHSVLPVLFAIGLAGCGGEYPADSKGLPRSAPASPVQGGMLKIAVVPKATNHEFWKAIHAGVNKARDELEGVQVIWKGPAREDDREQQINVVENFVNAGVSGIVLAPLDDRALVRPVREAMRAGVPVLIMDSGLQAEFGKDYVSFVATDNYKGGRNAARRLGYVLGGRGKVLVMRYQVGSASTTRREEGFLNELRKRFPAIEIASADQYAGPTTESAYAKAENLLNAFPEIDGIFCPCEPPVFGMLRALQESGRAGKVKFVGFDTSEKVVEALAAGQLHGLILQDPLNIGYLAVKTLVAHLRGETVATRIDTGSTVATPGNMGAPGIRELLSPPIGKYLR